MYRGDTSGLGLIRNRLRPFLLSLQHSVSLDFKERERMYHGNVMSGNAHNTITRKLNMVCTRTGWHVEASACGSRCGARRGLRCRAHAGVARSAKRAPGHAQCHITTYAHHSACASRHTKTLSCAPRRVRITAAQRDGATAVQPCEDKHGTAWYRTRSTLAMPAARHTCTRTTTGWSTVVITNLKRSQL